MLDMTKVDELFANPAHWAQGDWEQVEYDEDGVEPVEHAYCLMGGLGLVWHDDAEWFVALADFPHIPDDEDSNAADAWEAITDEERALIRTLAERIRAVHGDHEKIATADGDGMVVLHWNDYVATSADQVLRLLHGTGEYA